MVVSSHYGYCALLSTGHVDCWGYNYYGELGDGNFFNNSDVPVAVHAVS
jgi:alpha-tubulin suppressor-like RCC1 family protein